ncbi:threonine/serine exporter family protein [Nocardia colli]|uniref:Threonine/serine exporter family protein n=1 Tax=Nocardia colli TaxID=2545717 RepID=A0A5N0E8E1_9NOCA|nr:threonine/serine exporter family protein [Nocardia colli]KAA8885678.1 threonine/serine exporter family protein [Nocardia colli]
MRRIRIGRAAKPADRPETGRPELGDAGRSRAPAPKRRPRVSATDTANGPRRPVRQRRRRVTTAEQRRDIALLLRGSIYSGVTPSPTAAGEEYSPRQVIDFCLDLGEVMLSSGADARSVEVAIVAVSATWNLAAVELDFPGSSIHMVYAVPDEPTIAGLRAVRDTGADLHRLNNVYGVVDDIVGHQADMTQASRRLVEEIRSDPRWPYRVVAGAMGVLGVVVALQAGGTYWSAAGAFVLMFVLMYLGKVLGRRYLPTFFVAVAQMALATAVGSVAIAYSPIEPGEAASMVAACVVLLLPHPSIVATAQDAISGFRSLALVRGLGIGLVVLGMVTGIQAGLMSARWVDLEVDPSAIHLTGLTPFWALFASAIAAAANAFAQGATARVVPIAMAVAVFTQLIVQLCARAHIGLQLSLMLGAAILGALSTWTAARLRISPASIVVPAFCGALLPSLLVAHSLLQFIGHAPGSGVAFAFSVLTTLAIGAGLVLGNIVATGGARRMVSTRTRIRSASMDTEPRPTAPETDGQLDS